MGAWVHRLTGINPSTEIGNCQKCGTVRIIHKKKNTRRSIWVCQNAKQERNSKSAKNTGISKNQKKQYQKHPKPRCVMCGFIPEDPCQIDIDHIDGNHKNHSKDNLQALCANCHRLKTKRNKEGIYKNTLPNVN